jgi:TM2 domain-containing membrane protein YozV
MSFCNKIIVGCITFTFLKLIGLKSHSIYPEKTFKNIFYEIENIEL